MIIVLLSTIAMVLVLNFFIDNYFKTRMKSNLERQQQIEVLKVFTKNELFKNVTEQPDNFKEWITTFLQMKGYKDIKVIALENEHDITAIDRNGQKTFIDCKLWKEENWDKNTKEKDVKRLVGEMVASEGCRNGLIITSANIEPEAKEYIRKVGEKGFKLNCIDGDSLVETLYDLRSVRLKGLVTAVE